MRPRGRRSAELDSEQLRSYARVLVRAGYLDRAAVEVEVAESARHDHGAPDHQAVASITVARAVDELAAEQVSWPEVTDHDRLVGAFEELGRHGIVVLGYVDDHWTAAAELERRDEAGERVRGIVWFTPPDVWHAVQHGMLELNLWHATGANAAPGDELLADVLGTLARHGLAGHFDEGRVEVAATWQRRR